MGPPPPPGAPGGPVEPPRSDSNDDLRAEPSRACDACRKMKIRCIDKENPPCKRCRHMKLQCRFQTAPVPRAVIEETEATQSRLETLEGHVSGIFQKLDEISTVLVRVARAAPATPTSETSPRTAMSGSSTAGGGSNSRNNSRPGRPSSQTRLPRTDSYNNGTGSSWGSATYRPETLGIPAVSTGPPTGGHMPHEDVLLDLAGVPLPIEADGSLSEDDDPLFAAVRSEPFRDFTRREEELHLRADGLKETREEPRRRSRGRFGKRRRVQGVAEIVNTHGQLAAGSSDDEWEGPGPMRLKGEGARRSGDPIEMGWVSEAEGRELFAAFFKYAHPFVSVFDERDDTFDTIRKRSSFCTSVILMIALVQRESTGPMSEVSKRMKAHALNMAMRTLLSPVATLETVQGLVLLCSYTEHAWRMCCHAMALAVDMRLYRCLPYLHKIRMDSQHPNHLLGRQRLLVVGARVWMCVMRLSYEMSFNHALPIQFPSERGKRAAYARELLDHPYSTLSDTRLVIASELCEAREQAFQPYESVGSQDQSEVDNLLRRANADMHQLCDYWLDHYRRLGLGAEHFLRVELSNQKAYSLMFLNSPAWYGVGNKDDVKHLSLERQGWVASAMRSAAFLVSSVASKRLERDSEFGNHNFHVGIVATARYLIRMCELLPTACDLYQISLDIDRLLLKLPYYPVKPFADGLRRTLAKAREQGILPFTQTSEAALAQPSGPSPVGSTASSGIRATEAATALLPGLNPFPWMDPVQAFNDVRPTEMHGIDLLAAGVLPDQPAAPATGQLVPPMDSVAWSDDLNLANWFPVNDNHAQVMDMSALDTDMSNWFPAAPQLWLADIDI